MSDTEKPSPPPRLFAPVAVIVLGIAMCVLLALRFGRTNPNAMNSSSPSSAEVDAAMKLAAEFPPHPELSPKEVVERQMAAIQAARDDARQILGCFALASPNNRQSMGSPENLLAVIRANYSTMLSGERVEIGEAEMVGSSASVVVTVAGPDAAAHAYRFLLSRQIEPPYQDCWMTDAVLELRSIPTSPDAEPPRQSTLDPK